MDFYFEWYIQQVITKEESKVLDTLFGGEFGQAGVFEHIYGLGDDEDEDEGSLFNSYEVQKIEELKKYGWTIEAHADDEYLAKYTHENGIDSAISDTILISELAEYYKKNK